MLAHQSALVDLLLEYEVFRVGDFVLKSGRRSPYFVNAGLLRTGRAIAGVGRAFAAELRRQDIACELVFGPAYKGIPLAVATATALSVGDGAVDVAYGFDRKEVKDHGEGGTFVGTTPADGMRVVIVDDVVTSGMSIEATVALLRRAADVRISAVVVCVDRRERGPDGRSMLTALATTIDAPVYPVLDVRELVAAIRAHPERRTLIDDARMATIEAYWAEHCV